MEKQRLTLEKDGFILTNIELSTSLKDMVLNEDYKSIDKYFFEETKPKGKLFQYLSSFEDFSSIEFIISLRDAQNEWEEDGIWHDDGSRKLAFSLSIKDSYNTEGGVLEIRKKGSNESKKIRPFNFGEIVIFKTGASGYEHKINAVTKNKRLIIAGWCS